MMGISLKRLPHAQVVGVDMVVVPLYRLVSRYVRQLIAKQDGFQYIAM